MGWMDEYLHGVERSLRCPAERRPALVEELGGHLRDRAEALVAQGLSAADAERQATREMGPAWLLGLRLSAANGWRVTAHVFRELWAMGVVAELIILWSIVLESVHYRLFMRNPDPWARAYMWGTDAVMVVALPVVCFVISASIRGWIWAVVPALFLLNVVRPSQAQGLQFTAVTISLAALALVVAAAVGSGSQRRVRVWPAWAGAALAAVCAMACPVAYAPGLHASASARLWEAWREWVSVEPWEMFLAVLFAVPWMFWFAGSVFESEARKRLAGSAE